MKLTERHTFKTDVQQKRTLLVMRKKYNIKVSEFIRDAIREKLERDKDGIYTSYSELQTYIKIQECPF